MFSNFLYLLVALLIHTTASLMDATSPAPDYGWLACLTGAGIFAAICHLSFARASGKYQGVYSAGLDHAIARITTRLSLLAILVYAANFFMFRVHTLLRDIRIFTLLPTLEALIMLGMFLAYLALVWHGAWRVQHRILKDSAPSWQDTLKSHVSFSLPALLPWVFLSLFSDMIRFLPPGTVRDHLTSPTGEILYVLVFLAGVAVFGPLLIRRVWRCRSLPAGPVRTRIEQVCRMARLKYADILQWDVFGGTMITAGVMGLAPRYRYILVTPALLRSLDDAEMTSVILHEIGHVHHHHLGFYLFFFAGFVACNFVFFEPFMLALYVAEPVYTMISLIGIPKDQAHPLVLCLVLICFFVLYFRVIFGFFMRNFERQADLFPFRFLPDASPLIRTFYKIARLSRQDMDQPNWHHFSISQRIRFLAECQADPGRITAHHHRVARAITGFSMVLMLLVCLGYALSFGPFREPFKAAVAERILLENLSLNPENADMYVLVGDFHYNRGRYEQARDAYRKVLHSDPHNVHALNNLAWLLATCPDASLRDSPAALDLAGRAVSHARESHVLDTYAEALFINGHLADAVSVAREALERATIRHAYYQEQLERFETHQAMVRENE